MIERVKEKWYILRRYHCKEGFIDCFADDSANHPDNSHKSTINLNSTCTYYRLNKDGEWIDRNQIKALLGLLTIENLKIYTANEIWTEAVISMIRYMSGFNKKRCANIWDKIKNKDGSIIDNINNEIRTNRISI